MTILQEITAQRRLDVAAARAAEAPEALHARISQLEAALGPPLDVLARLSAPPREGWADVALAAEFKRASPSKGAIALDLDIREQVRQYATAGASMISVLTEPKWFQGSLQDMQAAREEVQTLQNRPAILRKDFIFDEYQLLEARAHGADCVLLIVAILDPELLASLIEATHKLGMTPLVEVNSVAELDIALAANAKLIGVNNRDLRTFKLDLDTTTRIAGSIRQRGLQLGRGGISLIALSGIRSHADVAKFEACGARGILIGEHLMKSGDVTHAIKELLQVSGRRLAETGDLTFSQPLAKVCGITKPEYALAALRSGANLIGIIMAEGTPRYVAPEQAKEIVAAVRKYGERTGPILPDIVSRYTSESSSGDWFQKNALALREACSRAPLVVGVFVNKSASEMNALAQDIGLDIVQLHGDEGFDICREVVVPTIRVFHLPDFVSSDGVDPEAILQNVKEGAANFLLLDTSVKGQHGGTGVTFDWKIAAIFSQARLPVLMAGGLTPENVVKALTIAHPLGVDVSSGVEVKGSPGVKDLDKIAAFLKAVKDFLAVAALKIDEETEA